MSRRTGVGSRCAVFALVILLIVAGQAVALACGVTVRIKVNGVDKTGQTQNWIVGRQVNLEGVVTGGTPTTKSWSIPGSRIKDCTASSASATVTNLTANDLQQSTVSLYWVDGGNGRVVTYTVTVNGQQYSANTTFNVKRPTATLTTATSKVDVGDVQDNYGAWWRRLIFMDTQTVTPGITFTRTFTEPAGFSGGTTQWVQVVNSVLIQHQKSSDGTWEHKQGFNVQDTVYPNDGNVDSTNDSPNHLLATDYSRVIVYTLE